MNAMQVLVHGTIQADGTLRLKEAPPLPAGPVEVLIRALPPGQNGAETWWTWLELAHAERLAQGQACRSKEAIDADRARQRELDEQRRQSIANTQAPQE